MTNFRELFTNEEIEEINVGKEFCQAMSVEGKPVVCFDVLADIINENVKLRDLSREELLTVYEQFKEFNEMWQDMEILDGRTLEKIKPKVKKIIKEELDSRRD
ncbi:hypothetical protein [Hydrogenispora ethanolica]|uniref:hypothetical protein n=1 Tax=Hydrogenispora ethanolica TaxID=1082276 RepID=UPI00104E406F|nr:hypothetical protein [Hydrogenispora ethanolica]